MVGEIEEPGFLEGGDYFAAGEDLALVGVGLRSNQEACDQLMERNWLGSDRLAVVRDDFEQHQVSWAVNSYSNIQLCCTRLVTNISYVFIECMLHRTTQSQHGLCFERSA